MARFRDLQASDPAWLATPKAQAWRRASLDEKEVTLNRIKQAVKMRFFKLAPADALARGGEERQLERAPGDTNATYAARLVGAWDLWKWAGTPFGLLTALRHSGFPGAHLEIVRGRQFNLDDSGALRTIELPAGMWTTRADRTFWSEFAVYFHANPFAPDVPADDDPRVELIRRMVRRWKSAHSVCSGIFVEISGRSWGWHPANPTEANSGTWADAGTWGGTVQRYSP